MLDAQTRSALCEIKELLLSEGWIQGVAYDPITGAHCMSEAINVVSYRAPYLCSPVLKTIRNAVVSLIPPDSLDDLGDSPLPSNIRIERWNDRSGRTAEEVIGLIDNLIDNG